MHEQYTEKELLAMILEEHEMNIAFEETAWTNGSKLNLKYNIVNQAQFDELKARSLATYKSLYSQDLSLYNKLLTTETEQIA